MWNTLQDRLITYLKLNSITNMVQFNAAAIQIMNWFNQHFAVKPESAKTSFVPLSKDNDLAMLLAVRNERTTCELQFAHLRLFLVSKLAVRGSI